MSPTGSPPRLALLFAGLALTLPFLFPEHRPPIRSFYDEWLALAIGLVAVGAAALARRSRAIVVPDIAFAFLLFACWLGVQAVLRRPAYVQLPIYGVLYLVFAAALAWLGHELVVSLGTQNVCDTLATFLLAGAMANAAAGVIQFYGVPDVLEGIVGRQFGVKAVGHVGQSNLYANYLALGQASLAYLFARRRLGGGAAIAAGIVLALAAALSQSRSALVFSAWLVVLAFFVGRGGFDRGPLRRAALASGLATIAAILLVPRIHMLLGIEIAHPFSLDRIFETADPDTARIENRVRIWPFAFERGLASPLVGVGWGEFAGAAFRVGLPRDMANEGEIWSSAHNVVLQTFSEAGAVAGLITIVAAAMWWFPVARALRRGDGGLPSWWLAALVGVETLHALVEYPLWYAHFLGVAALAMGMGSCHGRRILLSRAASTAGAVLTLGAFGLLGWTLVDYLRLDEARWPATGRTLATPREVDGAIATLQGVSRGPLAPAAEPWLFRSLPLDRETVASRIELGERVLSVHPDSRFVARHAANLALAGRDEEARLLVAHAVRTLPLARERIAGTLFALAMPDRAVLAPLLAQVDP